MSDGCLLSEMGPITCRKVPYQPMDDPGNERYERAHETSRVLALSDGVCAIIITLLVLEIHIPEQLHTGETCSVN
jgi:Endosomal/lysosomal potassium channel TMEM175